MLLSGDIDMPETTAPIATEHDPAYDRHVCSSCGSVYQRIDFRCAAHLLMCKNPVVGERAADFTADDARAIFDDAVKHAAGDPDRIAKIELVREFCCNPTFRQAVRDEIALRTAESDLSGTVEFDDGATVPLATYVREHRRT